MSSPLARKLFLMVQKVNLYLKKKNCYTGYVQKIIFLKLICKSASMNAMHKKVNFFFMFPVKWTFSFSLFINKNAFNFTLLL